MEKVSNKVLLDYISGAYLAEDLLEQLENNPTFMMNVINVTGDKRFYNLCSETVKNNYDFIKFLVLKYRDDLDFVFKVADKYFDSLDKSVEKLELGIIISMLTTQIEDERFWKYKVFTNINYEEKKMEIEIFKLHEKSKDDPFEIGLGFWYVFDLFSSSDIILSFFTKRFLEDLFDCKGNLEKVLHNNFKSVEDIDKIELKGWLLEFIRKYDVMLASYWHLEILDEYVAKINKYQNNWSNYERKEEASKYYLMLEEVHNYMEENAPLSLISETDLVYYIGSKLGIAEKIAKYENLDNEMLNYLLETLDDEFINEIFESNFEERKHYFKVKKIMKRIIFGKNDSVEDSDDNRAKMRKNIKEKMLKVDFMKKIKNK